MDNRANPQLTIDGDCFALDGQTFDMWGIRSASGSQSDEYTDQLIAQLDEYRAHGVNTITVFYMGSRGGASDPFSADGHEIDPAHQQRMDRIIRAAAARDMVVVVGIFYQMAPFEFRDVEAVRAAVRTVTQSLREYNNIILNIANEPNAGEWKRAKPVFDFQNPQNVIELAEIARDTDSQRIIGAGGYDHEQNITYGLSPALDVLLFDTAGIQWDSGTLYERFANAGITDKPMVNVEVFGGWTKRFPRGVFTDEVKQIYQREVDAAAARAGLSVFFHNNPWLQYQDGPLRFDLGGQGSEDDPGIRWYFEYVKQARGL